MAMILGDRIKELRENKKITHEQLAKVLGLTKFAIVKYERNEREPNLDTLKKIANYFSVTTDYLIGNSNFKTFQYDGFWDKTVELKEYVKDLPTDSYFIVLKILDDALQLSLQNKDDPEYIIMIDDLISAIRAIKPDLFLTDVYPYPEELAYAKLFEAYIEKKDKIDKLLYQLFQYYIKHNSLKHSDGDSNG